MAATSRSSAAKNISPLSPSPAVKKASKQTKQPVMCPICCEEVVDDVGRKRGHESIFCEGRCQEWVHRQCAGLSKVAFQAVANSDKQFRCPRCVIIQQSEDISALSATVSVLSRDVKALQEKLTEITINGSQSAKSGTSPQISTSARPDKALSSNRLVKPSAANNYQPQLRHGSKVLPSDSDRKFNIVVFGVSELPGGSSRFLRNNHDFQEVSSILSNLELGPNQSSSIRDCRRLGKYVSDSLRPRPLLVQLNSTADVYKVLSKRHNVSSSVSIKPDLSPANRKIEALLLKERWQLIESGVDRRSIKIRGSNIYVNNQLHGKVVDFILSLVSNSEVSPINSVSPTSLTTPIDSVTPSQVQPSNNHK